jgi:hypothetical protein
MHVSTVIVTRNAAISVKTLHSLLNANILTTRLNHSHDISFVNDDAFERLTYFLKKMKHCDRLVWIDYSINIDVDTLIKLYDKLINGYQCLVLPCVKPGIDWDLFKKKVLSGSQEPVGQMGLEFDTKVGKFISENNYVVTETEPKCWAVDTKAVMKSLRDKKGESIIVPARLSEMFKKFIERGVKIYADTGAYLTVTYPHECLGNILETAGVGVEPA